MKEYSMHYGKGEVKFSLDPALVMDELVINEFPALPDPAAAVLEAILWRLKVPSKTDSLLPVHQYRIM